MNKATFYAFAIENLLNTTSQNQWISPNFGHKCTLVHRCANLDFGGQKVKRSKIKVTGGGGKTIDGSRSSSSLCLTLTTTLSLSLSLCRYLFIAISNIYCCILFMTNVTPNSVFTARRSYASAVLGVVILFVRLSLHPSVCLSDTRVLCDKTKQCTADILIPLG